MSRLVTATSKILDDLKKLLEEVYTNGRAERMKLIELEEQLARMIVEGKINKEDVMKIISSVQIPVKHDNFTPILHPTPVEIADRELAEEVVKLIREEIIHQAPKVIVEGLMKQPKREVEKLLEEARKGGKVEMGTGCAWIKVGKTKITFF